MTDVYSYWMRGLAITEGKRQLTRDEMQALGISEDGIGSGFFRMRSGPRKPYERLVAIWEVQVSSEDGETMLHDIYALVDDEQVSPQEIWLYACRFPITEAEYRAAMADVEEQNDIHA